MKANFFFEHLINFLYFLINLLYIQMNLKIEMKVSHIQSYFI